MSGLEANADIAADVVAISELSAKIISTCEQDHQQAIASKDNIARVKEQSKQIRSTSNAFEVLLRHDLSRTNFRASEEVQESMRACRSHLAALDRSIATGTLRQHVFKKEPHDSDSLFTTSEVDDIIQEMKTHGTVLEAEVMCVRSS